MGMRRDFWEPLHDVIFFYQLTKMNQTATLEEDILKIAPDY